MYVGYGLRKSAWLFDDYGEHAVPRSERRSRGPHPQWGLGGLGTTLACLPHAGEFPGALQNPVGGSASVSFASDVRGESLPFSAVVKAAVPGLLRSGSGVLIWKSDGTIAGPQNTLTAGGSGVMYAVGLG
jgi:hypothetical protein